jgi:hypothetical protein
MIGGDTVERRFRRCPIPMKHPGKTVPISEGGHVYQIDTFNIFRQSMLDLTAIILESSGRSISDLPISRCEKRHLKVAGARKKNPPWRQSRHGGQTTMNGQADTVGFCLCALTMLTA